MKYRIKIYTFENGRQEFKAQVKTWHGWVGLWSDGSTLLDGQKYDKRQTVLDAIDKHYAGNNKLQTIEFEYITK